MEQPIQQFIQDYSPYLDDARRRFVFVALFFGVICVAGFFASPYILKFLIAVLNFESVEYAVFSPFRLLSTSMDIGLFLGIVLTLPLLFWELYEFLAPGCTPKEKRSFLFYLLVSTFLFALGFAYGVAVLYYAASAVASFNSVLGVENLWDIGSFVSQAMLTSAVLGVLFQFPLILSVLMRTGVLTRRLLTRGRKVAIAVTICVVALLPPTDGVSLIVMSVPLLALYELTLLLARETKGQAVPAPTLSVRPL